MSRTTPELYSRSDFTTRPLSTRQPRSYYLRWASSKKFSIQSGSPIPSWSERRTTMSDRCASTTPTSTSIVQRIPLGSGHRLYRWLRPSLLPRLLLRVSLDISQRRGSDQDRVHHPIRSFLLHDNVVCVEERWCNVSTGHPRLLQETSTSQC